MSFKHEFRLASTLEITAAAAKPLPDYCDRESAVRNHPARGFTGNVDYKGAAALADNGWSDAPRLDLLADQIAPAATRTAHEMHHAVAGAFVDVSRYIEGHPEDMLEFTEEPAPRSLSLAVQISKSASVSNRSMELAGAVALAVIDTLSSAGISAELYGYATAQGKANALTIFPLKRASEQVDPNQIAFWLCHPAAFRQLIFGFWDTCPKAFYTDTDQHSGGGRPLPTTAEALAVDYVISTSPDDEQEAAAEYARIIAEITASL
jgi:hypothetical protein